MKRIILSILCLSSLVCAEVPAIDMEQEIKEVVNSLSPGDKVWFKVGEELHRIIDDSMLDDSSEEALNNLTPAELITLFGSVSKKKCSKCCNSCSSCKKCKKCCCKVKSMLAQ